jgi:hypothetical protein
LDPSIAVRPVARAADLHSRAKRGALNRVFKVGKL